MKRRRKRLRNQLMLAFAAFTALTAALFGFYAVVFMYSTEDAFFDSLLRQEAAIQHETRARTGNWDTPRLPFLRVYTGLATLPETIGEQLAQTPKRTEFAGAEGRHYHLHQLSDQAGGTWLVAEVSAQLVVRPIRHRVLVWLAWSALTVVAAALLLGLWLAHRIAAPLARLAARVDGLDVSALPADLAGEPAEGEVGTLALALQRLTQRLHDYIARERSFTRDASHELRTPLTVIRAAAERLAHEPLSATGQQQLVHLQHSVGQLQQTMDMLLTLARAEASTDKATPVRVAPIVESVVVEQAILLENRPVEVEVAIDATATATVPAPVLRVLLSNLIGNAFEHTPSGRVTITAADGRLRIVNHSDGIAEVVAADWSEPYARREGSAGSGLGLTIVQRLAERYSLGLSLTLAANGADVSFALEPPASGL
ncbi:MAG: HAMP domain-containing histidine kinase [Rhodanobacteraceae bacterium]|nr:HAMP domain-containing histidine kinase [Rhodanobacteraceae bacterium]